MFNKNYFEMVLETIVKDYFIKAFNDSSKLMKESKNEDLVIIAPYWAIEKLNEYYTKQHYSFHSNLCDNNQKYSKYIGIDLLPGYEQKIIIFNKIWISEGKNNFNYYELELK
jgi:hypothetical protein